MSVKFEMIEFEIKVEAGPFNFQSKFAFPKEALEGCDDIELWAKEATEEWLKDASVEAKAIREF